MSDEDRWANEALKVNCVVFNEDTKEFLMVSNGICTKNHKNPDEYAKDHPKGDRGCIFRPYEGIALRIIGHNKGRPIYGWTYIKIPADANLTPAPKNHEWFLRAFSARRTKYCLGRL